MTATIIDQLAASLQQELQNNPIDVEETFLSTQKTNVPAQLEWWRTRQCTWDNAYVESKDVRILSYAFEHAINDCTKNFPQYPCVIKGTPRQQMLLILLLWHTCSEPLLKYHEQIASCLEDPETSPLSEEHYNQLNNNREQIITVLWFADQGHLGAKSKKLRNNIIAEVFSSSTSEPSEILYNWWIYIPDEFLATTVEGRAARFIGSLSFDLEAGKLCWHIASAA